jgi:hypothetical protein
LNDFLCFSLRKRVDLIDQGKLGTGTAERIELNVGGAG